jgi:hypothetical protein
MPPSLPVGGFHRRELPPPAVGFSSLKGKQLFRAADAGGGAECYFRLAEAFRTQDEPAFCGLGTLVTALNALEVDPGEVWKGSWRWYAETCWAAASTWTRSRRPGSLGSPGAVSHAARG